MGRFSKTLVIVALVAGAWHWFHREKLPTLATWEADIEVYTTPWCGVCKQAKKYMDAQGIAYLEKDVEASEAFLIEFHERGGRVVPYFFIHGKPLVGFDERRFETLRAAGARS